MQTFSTLAAALSLSRLLIVVSLAAALVAIPAAAQEEDGARRVSEYNAVRACNFLGGDLIELPLDESVPSAGSIYYCDVTWGFGVDAFICSYAHLFGPELHCTY